MSTGYPLMIIQGPLYRLTNKCRDCYILQWHMNGLVIAKRLTLKCVYILPSNMSASERFALLFSIGWLCLFGE